MKKIILYIENSVFGFYYDDKPENKTKVQATRQLFEQIKIGIFTAFTSQITIKELSAAPLSIRNKLLSLISDYNVEVVKVNEQELECLVKKYMDEHIIPQEFEDDAIHVASATILRVDYLVSFNLEHIVNEWNVRKFNAVNLKEGYYQIAVRTPEEIIYYGY